MKRILESRMVALMATGDTDLLKFCFAWCSLGWSFFILAATDTFRQQFPSAAALGSPVILGWLFVFQALASMYGVLTGRSNVLLLLVESLLGLYLWGGMGIAEALGQGVPGPLIFGGFISLLLFVRYPNQGERRSKPRKRVS